MSERLALLIILVRHMHARLASINDMEEILESVMEDVNLPVAERDLVRKELGR